MIGKKLGHYEVVGPLGSGGMGEVYRARDINLDREVAIKVLPEDFAADAERLARFEREAKLLASLNDANIAGIYGLEEVDGQRFIAMELVEGETLAERITAGGAMDVDTALEIARQIAVALEAAHGQGVVHRDLKPANIKVTPEGKVKVLDFGLAKGFEADGSASDISPDLSRSPTIAPGTRIGVLLGTAAYMSPEQAKAKALDKRTDNWSFGCVLYEMLTGRRAFRGDDVSETLAAILKDEPDWDLLPSSLPPTAAALLRRCLRKQPSQRLHDIADARIEIEEAQQEEPPQPASVIPSTRQGRVAGWAAGALIGLVGLVAGAGIAFRYGPGDASAPREPHRFVIPSPSATSTTRLADPAISPDGSLIVFSEVTGQGARRLFLQQRGAFTAQPLPGTESALAPFFSPDGLWVGFLSDGALRKVSVLGGDPLVIVDDLLDSPGASWGPNDTILFSRDWTSELWRVSSDGGEAEAVTTLDADDGEVGHWWPDALPDGRTVLFTIWTVDGDLNRARIGAVDLETGERRTLFEGARPRYVASGHLIFYHRGSYQAVAFDPQRLEATSSPRPVLGDTMRQSPYGARNNAFDVSSTGTLVSVSGSYVPQSSLVWIDRDGVTEPLPFEPQPFRRIRISPDGRRIAAAKLVGGNFDIWIYDLERGSQDQLTSGANNFAPVWHPQGDTLAFSSTRSGSFDVFSVPVNDASAAAPLVRTPTDEVPYAWSPDGGYLIVTQLSPEVDVWRLPIAEPTAFEPLVESDARDYAPSLSPDGRWVAFLSLTGGQGEIYVQSARGERGIVRVSTDGGHQPLWSPTRNELYFRTRSAVMVVPYDVVGDEFRPGRAQVLFETETNPAILDIGEFTWDVSPDGDRFLILDIVEDEAAFDEVRVTVDWFDELRALIAEGTG